MDDHLELLCENKEEVDKMAKQYAYSYQDNQVHQVLEQYEEEEAEIVEVLDQDLQQPVHTEEAIMEYGKILYQIRRVVFYLRERFHTIIENNSMDELMESFQGMNT